MYRGRRKWYKFNLTNKKADLFSIRLNGLKGVGEHFYNIMNETLIDDNRTST